jgi:hypothetical protein
MDIEGLRLKCIRLFKELANVPGSTISVKDVAEFTNRINDMDYVSGLQTTIAELQKEIDEAVKSNQISSELSQKESLEELERQKEAEEMRRLVAENPNAAKFL